jgi:threonine/homoserine/homoserine lactone efflux protein
VSGIHDLALFVIAGLVLNLTPGPDMAYIAARSASGGFRDGAAAVFGITAGCFVHTFAAALGLSAIVATSATAFEIVKWCGALYLLYAGVRLLLASARRDAASERENVANDDGKRELAKRGHALRMEDGATIGTAATVPSAARIFREALLINVFNPKVALFFLAFVPQFIDAHAAAKPVAFLLLGALFNFNSLFVNLPVAWLASRAGTRLRDEGLGRRWLQRATGAIFVILAMRVAAVTRN